MKNKNRNKKDHRLANFLLAVVLYLLLTVAAQWAINGIVAATTGGELRLHRQEALFTLAYLLLAVLPALWRLYTLSACLVTACGIWRLTMYASVLFTKSYAMALDLFGPLYYALIGTATALGIVLEIRHRRLARAG